MTPSRRSVLAAGAGLAGVGAAALAALSAEANATLMRGDVDSYRALVPMADDFTLMSPFGGPPSHGVSAAS